MNQNTYYCHFSMCVLSHLAPQFGTKYLASNRWTVTKNFAVFPLNFFLWHSSSQPYIFHNYLVLVNFVSRSICSLFLLVHFTLSDFVAVFGTSIFARYLCYTYILLVYDYFSFFNSSKYSKYLNTNRKKKIAINLSRFWNMTSM